MTTEETLRDLLAQGLSDEELARALLELTLQAAPPAVADAVRVCALPAYFDAEMLALLLQPLPPDQKRLAKLLERLLAQIGQSPQPTPEQREAAAVLLERVAAFSFVLPREGGGYVYHESTRARLLDWWRLPQNRARYAALTDRLADHFIALAEEQVPRLKGPHYLAALSVLDAAYPNLRAAWEGAAETESWPRLRSFAYALHDYFMLRGRWAEWIAWTQAGLDACARLGDERGSADMQIILGNAYLYLPTGDRAANLQQAIACYREALRFRTPEAAPLDYAATQNNLGNAYLYLPTGDRAANLQQAIACYREAVRFRTPEAAPLDYATTQNNLGNAYQSLPTGDRAANLEAAIACYREALRFYTPEAAPLAYAATQNNLGLAYADLPSGDRAANLQQAIACYREALRFRTPEAAPLDYAMTQNNLGLAYADLPIGDRAANLQQAIECYREALRFYTPEAAPLDYATTQNNLGNAYADLPTGDRAANLQQAIACYREALRFRTPEAAPLDYAATQNNLGTAYADLPTGDRAANLQQAIACYREALRFYTPEAAPLDYATTQNNLGLAYADLPSGDRAANLQQAIACFQSALAVEHLSAESRTRYSRNLGDALVEQEDYPAAVAAYRQAIDLAPDNYWLFNALGNAYSRQGQHELAVEAYTEALGLATAAEDKALLHRNRADSLIRLGRLEEAEQDCAQARALAPDHPYTHARLGQLAFARAGYAAAVEHYTAAIERQAEAGFYFDRGRAYLALGRPDRALADYQAGLATADPLAIARARQELEEFATEHPDIPGLEAVRALLAPHSPDNLSGVEASAG